MFKLAEPFASLFNHARINLFWGPKAAQEPILPVARGSRFFELVEAFCKVCVYSSRAVKVTQFLGLFWRWLSGGLIPQLVELILDDLAAGGNLVEQLRAVALKRFHQCGTAAGEGLLASEELMKLPELFVRGLAGGAGDSLAQTLQGEVFLLEFEELAEFLA